MGLTEGHWFEDEEQLTERQLERAIADEKAAYERGLRDGERKSNWISVKDRLPEKQRNYLVYVPPVYTNVVYFNGYEWVVDEEEYCFISSDITHWMPLPEPPKEG